MYVCDNEIAIHSLLNTMRNACSLMGVWNISTDCCFSEMCCFRNAKREDSLLLLSTFCDLLPTFCRFNLCDFSGLCLK
jgi:hypothetical protein